MPLAFYSGFILSPSSVSSAKEIAAISSILIKSSHDRTCPSSRCRTFLILFLTRPLLLAVLISSGLAPAISSEPFPARLCITIPLKLPQLLNLFTLVSPVVSSLSLFTRPMSGFSSSSATVLAGPHYCCCPWNRSPCSHARPSTQCHHCPAHSPPLAAHPLCSGQGRDLHAPA